MSSQQWSSAQKVTLGKASGIINTYSAWKMSSNGNPTTIDGPTKMYEHQVYTVFKTPTMLMHLTHLYQYHMQTTMTAVLRMTHHRDSTCSVMVHFHEQMGMMGLTYCAGQPKARGY